MFSFLRQWLYGSALLVLLFRQRIADEATAEVVPLIPSNGELDSVYFRDALSAIGSDVDFYLMALGAERLDYLFYCHIGFSFKGASSIVGAGSHSSGWKPSVISVD